MGAYLWPWSECLLPLSVPFYSPTVTLDAFWFVDFSFLSLFSQEAVKAAGMCVYICVCVGVCVCVSRKYSILALAPALWSLSFFSAVVLRYATRW